MDMEPEKKGLCIIFHSGDYDRVQHGMSVALAAAALGRRVKIFFTYWSLEYLRRDKSSTLTDRLDKRESAHIQLIRQNIEKGHLESMQELISQTKALGVQFYACTNSMSFLNIARDELIDEIDRPTGLTSLLTEAAEDQMLFI